MKPEKILKTGWNGTGESLGCETPEYRRMTPAPPIPQAEHGSKYITIPVVDYHLLLKDHTLLEAILHAEPYCQHSVIEAARKTLGFPEAGAYE